MSWTASADEPVRRTIVIPPGEAEHVIVDLDTRFASGKIQKLTRYTTNDPKYPRFELLVTASIVTDRLYTDVNGKTNRVRHLFQTL